MRLSPNARVALQYILLALTWGSSFLFIKVGLDGLSPAQVAWAREQLDATKKPVALVVPGGVLE